MGDRLMLDSWLSHGVLKVQGSLVAHDLLPVDGMGSVVDMDSIMACRSPRVRSVKCTSLRTWLHYYYFTRLFYSVFTPCDLIFAGPTISGKQGRVVGVPYSERKEQGIGCRSHFRSWLLRYASFQHGLCDSLVAVLYGQAAHGRVQQYIETIA